MVAGRLCAFATSRLCGWEVTCLTFKNSVNMPGTIFNDAKSALVHPFFTAMQVSRQVVHSVAGTDFTACRDVPSFLAHVTHNNL